MAATYAALLALARSLREILDLEKHVDPLHKGKILSLHEKVDFIVTFFEDYSDKHLGTLDFVGNGIREAAYKAQDFMDSYLCWLSTTDDDDGCSSSEANGDEVKNLDGDLTMASERIDFILEETMKMKNSDAAKDLRGSVSYSSAIDNSSTVQATAKKMVVGFDEDLMVIKEMLYEDAAKLQIIPIVGMGGIGKTTLARRAYEDSIVSDQYFDICAWITVSQEYRRKEILSRLFKSLTKSDDDESDESEAELAKRVYQNLLGRRYLIVIDDIWSPKAWDDLKMIFPDDGNGSRILLTTRILEVASYAGCSDTLLHQMSFINEDQSWELLQQRVFGQQSCPLQLVEVGKKIAKNCGGLPLTIVVVAGLLLSSGNNAMREEVWENISENISSREPTIALQCSKILCFSYDRLPLRLKPCFLYIAAFPEDSEIDVSKLIKLWVAEGFLKPNDGFKCLEDVGERNLDELVKRSLVLGSKKGLDGKLKRVGIHDMLREICITKAEEEEFLHHVSSKTDSGTEFVENPYGRRLTFQMTKGNQEWEILDSCVRSILIFPKHCYIPRLSVRSRHMCILDAPRLRRTDVSNIISTFHNLRYFHMSMFMGFPVSISKHANLETIVARETIFALELPYEILKMRKLRHLIFHEGVRLSSYTSDMGIVHESDLQTIETVIDFVFAEEITRILLNLKKLKAKYNMPGRDWDDFNLDNLSNLRNLEHLEITMQDKDQDRDWCLPSMRWNHAFPLALKKLSLEGVPLPWENMTLIGSLPNLQALNMEGNCGTEPCEWTTVEGEFLQLKCFCSSLDHVVKWETEKEHFPCLETLILDSVVMMDEIPSGIGEIDTLQYIELRCCGTSLVDSAKLIESLQHENGNDAFRVRVIGFNDYDDVLF